MSTNETLGRSDEDRGDALPEARALAAQLDTNHAAEPGGLQDIGTCRRCGMLIATDEQGVWRHRPSVGEIDAGELWINQNANRTGAD
jgi:hypothetical protein